MKLDPAVVAVFAVGVLAGHLSTVISPDFAIATGALCILFLVMYFIRRTFGERTLGPKLVFFPTGQARTRCLELSTFSKKHLEVAGHVNILLSVYTTCQPHVREPVDLDEAFEHVCGACLPCHRNFQRGVDDQNQYIRGVEIS